MVAFISLSVITQCLDNAASVVYREALFTVTPPIITSGLSHELKGSNYVE